MPASLPGSTLAENLANPSKGATVIFDALSGPKNSLMDASKIDYLTVPPTGIPPGWTAQRVMRKVNDSANLSTGALSTGVGYGSPPVIGLTAPQSIEDASFTDDYKPGISTPEPADSTNSRFMYIGGGRSAIVNGTGPNGNGYPPGWFSSQPNPFTAGFGIAGAGNGGLNTAGGSRDAGTGPSFTGFDLKMVTATVGTANGAAVEAGWVNRSGAAILFGQSVFGLGTAAMAAPTVEVGELEMPLPDPNPPEIL